MRFVWNAIFFFFSSFYQNGQIIQCIKEDTSDGENTQWILSTSKLFFYCRIFHKRYVCLALLKNSFCVYKVYKIYCICLQKSWHSSKRRLSKHSVYSHWPSLRHFFFWTKTNIFFQIYLHASSHHLSTLYKSFVLQWTPCRQRYLFLVEFEVLHSAQLTWIFYSARIS